MMQKTFIDNYITLYSSVCVEYTENFFNAQINYKKNEQDTQ